MVVLEIDNSYSRVLGLQAQDFSKLRKILSYSLDSGNSYKKQFTYRRSLLDKKGNFPTGLLHYVQDFLLNTPHTVSDRRKIQPPPRVLRSSRVPFKPYSWQSNALRAVKSNLRGGVIAPTGTGKSLLMAMIIDFYRYRTLIVVPTVEIRDQMRQTMWTLFGSVNGFIDVENIDSPRLRKVNNYDLLLIDECHRSAAKTYQKLNKTMWTGTRHRYFFSATYFRNSDNENILLEGIVGKPIFELSYLESIVQGYIVPVEAYYIQVPKTRTGGFTWGEVYKDLVINNTVRNDKINSLLEALKDKSTLCLVKEIAHGGNIIYAPFVNGQDAASRWLVSDFNRGVTKQLVATTGIMGEGVDTKPCEYVIYAGLGKAKSAFMQAVGRAVRRYPGKESAKVIIFKDDSHKWTRKHFREQCKILFDEYGVKPVELKI